MWGDEVWYCTLFVLSLSLYLYWITKRWNAEEKGDKDVNKQTTVSRHAENKKKANRHVPHKPEFPVYFPYLVWKKVMEFITTKEDIENCYNSCHYFRQFLHEKRKIEVVLPQVFQILLAQELGTDCIWIESFYDFFEHRLICKSINSAVEEIFERDILEVWERDNFVMFRPQRFLDHFEATHYDSVLGKPKKNPFLGGTVQIYERLRRGQIVDIQVFRNSIMEIFRKYGKGIQRLHICLHEHDQVIQFARLYRQLQDMMTFLPNLKNLNLSFSNSGNISEHTLEELRRIQGLDQEMARNPMPRLANLKLVSVEGPVPPIIFHQLILPNRHITELKVCSCLFKEVADSLPYLMDLKLEICTIESWTDFETFSQLHLLNLKLDISNLDEEFITWSRVLSAVETKMDRERGTELCISMPEPLDNAEKIAILEDSLVHRLEMPQLQVFTIETRSTKFCLDFLLSCRNSLKKITAVDKTRDSWENIFSNNDPYVSVDGDNENAGLRYGGYEERQIIKFLDFEDNVQNSNIPTELPVLEKMILHTAEREVISYQFKDGEVSRSLLE